MTADIVRPVGRDWGFTVIHILKYLFSVTNLLVYYALVHIYLKLNMMKGAQSEKGVGRYGREAEQEEKSQLYSILRCFMLLSVRIAHTRDAISRWCYMCRATMCELLFCPFCQCYFYTSYVFFPFVRSFGPLIINDLCYHVICFCFQQSNLSLIILAFKENRPRRAFNVQIQTKLFDVPSPETACTRMSVHETGSTL